MFPKVFFIFMPFTIFFATLLKFITTSVAISEMTPPRALLKA